MEEVERWCNVYTNIPNCCFLCQKATAKYRHTNDGRMLVDCEEFGEVPETTNCPKFMKLRFFEEE